MSRLPHIESIKFMEPTLTADQLAFILQRLLRLNPARPDLALRSFSRRRRHFQLMRQPPPPDISAPTTPQPPETNFTIGMNNRPQSRPLSASSPVYPTVSAAYVVRTTPSRTARRRQPNSLPNSMYATFTPHMMMTQPKTLSSTP